MKLISQLAKETGVPIHTIRYYEKYGLLKGKKDAAMKSNNYSWYDDETAEKVELIKEAKMIGFTLAEIKKLLDAWHGRRLSPDKKIEILHAKLKEIDDKIYHLKAMKKLIVDGIKDVEQLEC